MAPNLSPQDTCKRTGRRGSEFAASMHPAMWFASSTVRFNGLDLHVEASGERFCDVPLASVVQGGQPLAWGSNR